MLIYMRIMMYYLVYRITNLKDNKYYIGAHRTLDINDDYMGSGLLIERAIKRHGLSSFQKEILHIADNEEDMWKKESELVVTIEKDPLSYNLIPGGFKPPVAKKGRTQKRPKFPNGYNYKHSEETKAKIGKWTKENNPMLNPESKANFIAAVKGKKKSEEHKKKISDFVSTLCWVTDGENNIRISKTDPIPNGYRRGRYLSWRSGRKSKSNE